MSTKHLTVKAFADRFELSLSTVRRMILERRIEVVRVGRLVRISESAVDKYLARNTSPALVERRSQDNGRHRKGVASVHRAINPSAEE